MNRRDLFRGCLGAVGATSTAIGQRLPSPEKYRRFSLRKETNERVLAGWRVILDELKPTRAQLERGLDLHYNSYVAEVMGCLYVADPAITMTGDRLKQELDRFRRELENQRLSQDEIKQRVERMWRRMKPFESAFDPHWREDYLGLYQLTGIDLAIEDVAHPHENNFRAALEHLARCEFVYERTDDIIKASNLEDIKRAREQGKTCVMYHLAGVGCFAESDTPLENLDLFYALGVRTSQLTYRQKNLLCCSDQQEKDTGLTLLGRQVVQRMNQLGMMIHLAHAGHRSALEVVEASQDPVYNAHTACKSIYDNTKVPNTIKNQDDDYLRTLAKRGGLAAVYAWPGTLSPKEPATFGDWARHLEHAVKVMGIDHVAICTDLTHLPDRTPQAMDWTNWPYFTVGLVCRGFRDGEIRKLLGENFLQFAQQVLKKRPWGPLV